MKKQLTVLLAFALLAFSGFGQQSVEELKTSLKQQTNVAARMHIQLEIGDLFQNTNSDSALYWYRLAIPYNIHDSAFFATWLESSGDAEKYYLAVALARSGLIMAQKRMIDEGAKNLSLAVSLAIGIGQQQLALYASDNLAVVYAKSKNPLMAIQSFEQSLSIYKELNDEKGIVYCLGNLGAINANEKKYYQAAEYYEQLLKIQEQTLAPLETLDDLINIAALYTQLEELDKAKPFWERALDVAMQLKNDEKTALCLTNLGAIGYKNGDMVSAQTYYSQLLNIAQNIQNQSDEVLALNNLATISYNLGDLSKSVQYWEEALALASKIGRVQVVLDALINLSNINYQLENFEKSSQYLEQYVSIGKQVGTPQSLAQSYIGIAEIQEKIKDYTRARGFYQETSKIYNDIGDKAGVANVNVLIGRSFLKEQRYYAAMDFFKVNIDGDGSLPPLVLGESYHGMADLFRLQIQYTIALENYQKAKDLYMEAGNLNQASVCLNTMGLIQQIAGDFPKSIAYYETALGIVKEMGNREGMAAIYNNLGVVYRQLGDLPKAHDSYQKALAIYLELNNEEGASYGYNNLGVIFEQSGDYDKANEYYEKSLAIKQTSEDKVGLSSSLMNMGNVYKHLKKYDKAEEFYNQSLAMCKELNDKQGIALTLGSLAALKLEMYDYNTAVDYANQSLAVAQEIDMQSVIKEAYRQLAWAHNATFVPEWAEEAYLNVISMNYKDINRNFSILSESEKELFFKTIAEDFDRFHSFALQRMATNPTITGEVYNNLLRNKGLLLKSGTAMRNAILGSGDEKLIQLFENWIQVKQEVAKLYTLPIQERTADPVELEKKANELEISLVKGSSEFSDFEKSLRIEWTDVKQGLKPGEAAIEFTNFAHGRDSVLYCALIITPDCENPWMVPLFEERQLVNILGSYAGNNYQYINSVYGKNNQPNTALYDIIWRPMEQYLKDIDNIYISPGGLLHKVSFSTLCTGENSYIIDHCNLFLLSTTAKVTSMEKFLVDGETTFGLFGGITYSTVPSSGETWNYLKGTLDETAMISGLLKEQFSHVQLITDTLATEERFKSVAPQCQALHLATHGFFFPDPEEIRIAVESVTEEGEVEFRGGTPNFGYNNFVQNQNPLMRSGLVFAGVNDYWGGAKAVTGDDGVLTSLEVINIDLRKNKLVVLSACETGLGDIAGSEGVYGLQRAFKMAGTNFLIMSLWQIPDKETAEFMQTFYTLLIKEKDLQNAFTQTQSIMRQQYDPYFWAAFVLVE